MKKAVAGIVLALSVLCLVPKAQAGSIYLGLQGGFSMQKAKFSNMTFNTDTSFLYGAKAGMKFMMFAVELNYLQAAHNLDSTDISVPMWRDRKVDYSYLGANVRWIFPILVVQPYLTAGYGFYTADIHDIDKDQNGGFNVGAGVELMLGEKFSLSAEGRYHHVTLDITTESFKVGDFSLTGGINIYF
jgi:opacity protein-like surface antigen